MKIKRSKEDIYFSKLIKERDQKCQFCGRAFGKLENSHFWGRGKKSVRFDPRNCDLLCFQCHANNEGNKQGFYREWKLKQLGQKVYDELEQRSKQLVTYHPYEKALIYEHMRKHGLEGLKEKLYTIWKP